MSQYPFLLLTFSHRPTSFAAEDTVLRRQKTARNYENIVRQEALVLERTGVARKPRVAMDGDVMSFLTMVRGVRRRFPADDMETNTGIVGAARIEAVYPGDTQVRGSLTLWLVTPACVPGEVGGGEGGVHGQCGD